MDETGGQSTGRRDGVPATVVDPAGLHRRHRHRLQPRGSQAVEDIEDLFRSKEDERAAAGASPATIEAIEWMSSLEAAQTLADLAAMDVIEVFSPSRACESGGGEVWTSFGSGNRS